MAPIDPTSWMPITNLDVSYKRVEALCEAIKTKHSVNDRKGDGMFCRHSTMPLRSCGAEALPRGSLLASAQRYLVSSQTIAALGAATATSLGGGR